MARVQCSISSVSDGGGNFGCSTKSHPSKRFSFFLASALLVVYKKLGAELGRFLSYILSYMKEK